jgi:microcystin-dependent protein
MEGYIACMSYFAGNFAPRNWSYCQGQILSIAQNTALFSLLGTTYGGNGQTTFALPNAASRLLVGGGMGPGPSLSNYVLGEITGTETATMTTASMPSHNHTLTIPSLPVRANATQDADGPTSAVFATTANTIAPYGALPGSPQNGGAVTATATCFPSGNGIPFNIQQPYLGMNIIICLYGIFPSRN